MSGVDQSMLQRVSKNAESQNAQDSSPAYGIEMISQAILMQISVALDVIVIHEIIRRYPA
jgi:hypothetical protein